MPKREGSRPLPLGWCLSRSHEGHPHHGGGGGLSKPEPGHDPQLRPHGNPPGQESRQGLAVLPGGSAGLGPGERNAQRELIGLGKRAERRQDAAREGWSTKT